MRSRLIVVFTIIAFAASNSVVAEDLTIASYRQAWKVAEVICRKKKLPDCSADRLLLIMAVESGGIGAIESNPRYTRAWKRARRIVRRGELRKRISPPSLVEAESWIDTFTSMLRSVDLAAAEVICQEGTTPCPPTGPARDCCQDNWTCVVKVGTSPFGGTYYGAKCSPNDPSECGADRPVFCSAKDGNQCCPKGSGCGEFNGVATCNENKKNCDPRTQFLCKRPTLSPGDHSGMCCKTGKEECKSTYPTGPYVCSSVQCNAAAGETECTGLWTICCSSEEQCSPGGPTGNPNCIPKPTPSATPTATPSSTPTASPSATPTSSPRPTVTPASPPPPTPTASATPSGSPSASPTGGPPPAR